jgi:hypothetical protein
MYTHLMVLDYNRVIEESRKELSDLVRVREETDKRISQVIKALRGLAPMLPDKEKQDLLASLKTARRKGLGLTEMIVDVLRESATPLSGSEIRDRLEDSGLDMAEYSQASATIHNTLRRLADGHRVLPVFPKDLKDSKGQLRWKLAGGKK